MTWIERDRTAELGAVAASLALTLTLAACGPDSQASEPGDDADAYVKVVNVGIQEVEPVSFTSYIRLTGEVEAFEDVVVSAEESGVIERFFVEKGRYVQRGAPLAKIEDDVLRAQVNEAAAAAQLAAERYERQRRLWEEEKIGSEIAYLETKYQAELQAARHQMLGARLDRTLLRAPVSGVFDERYVDAGEMVSAGTRVGRIVEIDRLKVTGGVAERFAPSVSVGDTARVRLNVLPAEEFAGVIEYVGTAVDPLSRTFPVEIVIENPGRVLKPQMVASVEIADVRLDSALVAPQPAILRTEDGYQVFVVTEKGGELVAEARPVRLGPAQANRTVIEQGLNPGDRLIVRGQQLVEIGDRVRIVDSEEQPALENGQTG